MRIVFAGSGSFGMPSLEALLEGGQEVVLVATQPSRPAGRGRQVRDGPIKGFARRRDIPLIQPENINTPGTVEKIRQARPDLLLVIAFGQKIGRPLLDLPPYGAINLHASLLPRYRGAAPIHWALINGDTGTGLTVIAMTDRMDAGDILGQRATPMDPAETAGQLHDRLSHLGARLVTEVVQGIPLEEIERRRQNESQATSAPALRKSDGRILWDRSALEIHNRIRGTTPWPGAFTHLAPASGKPPLRLVVAKAMVSPRGDVKAEPGVVVACGPEGIDVAAATGAVRLLELTPAGKRMMSGADFLNGYKVKPGTRFLSLEDRADGGRD